MLKALNLPKGAKEELAFGPEIADKVIKGLPLWEDVDKKAEGSEEEDESKEENQDQKPAGNLSQEQKYQLTMFGEGKYHLIPSFFRTLIFLKKQKKEFALAFRTFGKDLKIVEWEFNEFCSGNHPCFSGRNGTPLIKFDGSKGTKDLRIRTDLQKGLFFRYSNELQDTKLLLGTNDRKTNNFDEVHDWMAEVEAEDWELIQDNLVQYQHMIDTMKKMSTMSIQDDYENWASNDNHREVAKLLLIDQADYSTQHIFFDDNADE